VCRGISVFFLLTSSLDVVDNATLRPLNPRERHPIPVEQEAGWAPGSVWTGSENVAPMGIRSPDCPSRREPQYGLSYPGPLRNLRKVENLACTFRGMSYGTEDGIFPSIAAPPAVLIDTVLHAVL